jgi:hypothetical protein
LKLLRIIFLLVVGSLSGWAQAPATGPAALTEPGDRLLVDGDDPTWRPLLEALAAKGSIEAEFTEQRWFSFRRDPVVLTGEIRRSPELGLSLRYLEPDEKMMIVDDRGIVLRNARGWSRQLKPGGRAPNSGEVLLRVLRFDWAGLSRDFAVQAARNEDSWRFDFVPLTDEFAGSVGTITVWGQGEAVTQLEMNPTDGPRIEILIGRSREDVTFTPDEVKKFFR